jgi:tetratricopeptide (TPR) repeat protein
MRRSSARLVALVSLGCLLGAGAASGASLAGSPRILAAPTPPPATASAATAAAPPAVKAAGERSISAGPIAKPTGTKGGGAQQAGGAGRPGVRGPKIPEAMRLQMKAQLDKRIDDDLGKIRGLRKEAIGLLTKFVAESPRESREMPEALMRLGELKWELERESFVDRFKEWEKKPVDQRGPTPQLEYGPSRDLFARVLKDYPWFSQYDLALYIDGFLATEQGKTDDALVRFERILKEFPNSRFTPDAHMAKAEAIFNSKYDYAAALVEYEEVLKFKQSELYGLALFKSAWCLWRLGKNDEAARRFVSVFEVTDTQGKTVSAQQRKQLDELQGEALKYLVEVFTEDEKNTAADLYNFLQKIGGDRFAGKIVKALAETYFDQAHYERGIEAYELLLKLEPTSRDAVEWILQIASAYWQLEDYARLKATYERALAQYTTGGPWARTQADQAHVAAMSAKIEARLREHALALHSKAQKDKTSRAEFEGAAGLYVVYLSKFSSEPKSYYIYFYLGEIELFRLERHTDAATHYMAAARKIPDAQAKTGELATMRHDALYNAIAALERVRFQELEARRGKPGPAVETDTDKRFAEALDLYAQLYPTDPVLPELFFKQGKFYYDNGVYDSAVKIWGTLLEKFPQSPYARDAGELILDSFNRAKNYENIETWARKLKSLPTFAGAEQQKKLDALIVQAVFKQGEQKATAGEHKAAAAAYLRAAKEFPRDARAAQACVNAEQEAKLAGDVAVLKEAAQLAMGKDYRDKPESPQGAWIAATTFQAMGLFSDAAEFDEAIAGYNDREHPNYQKFEHTKDAAYNAVVLRVATGEHDKAVLDGQKFVAAYGTTPEADEVFFLMARAHQNAGRYKDAIDLYRRYVPRAKADKRVQAFVFLAIAQLKTGDERGADDSLKQAVDLGKFHGRELSPEGKYAAARARYMEGERVLARFEAVQIAGDVKQLTARLKQKAELLKEAAKVFLDCVSMGVAEWTTAALFQIGRTYELFAKSLRDSPAPAGLSDADKQTYQSQIEEFAVPIEERSLDAYENGWKKAIELGIYNQWTAKMRDALGRLNAELYPAFKEVGFEVRSQGPSPFPALIDAPKRGVAANAANAPAAPKK